MLYQIGPVTVDVFPFNADSVEEDGSTEYAKKDLLGRMPGREFTGEGDEKFSIRGQVFPTKIGGLTEIETLNGLRRSGERVMVVRGDGKVLGWHAIESVRKSHEMLGPNGVGQVIKHDIVLVRVDAPGSDAGATLLSMLLSLF
ncbi:tail protein [Rhodomicrobium udaipurense JA643]|uniref:Phage tail protein n=1 Tax=Rhodomicrobium udaipurense TaxID=1202716 RepID=A0A8I1GHP7_9HYPH|nr:phage tail protein [Rhodomicrobium udaipurense]KAI93268.1 tail protein [Rhodomicrobium udaipurense JA643]MBJ7543277.1 phage tail protein [Rhodomicrobium udaipurense]